MHVYSFHQPEVVDLLLCEEMELHNLPAQLSHIASSIQTEGLEMPVASAVSLAIQLIFFLGFLLLTP
jgi:hypothetical protein